MSICISDRSAIADIAGWADQAELFFVRHDDYRRELLDWMRLSQNHPRYLWDGLNREALAMNAAEATAARFVLGPLFAPLDRFGLAAPLLSDRAKTASARPSSCSAGHAMRIHSPPGGISIGPGSRSTAPASRRARFRRWPISRDSTTSSGASGKSGTACVWSTYSALAGRRNHCCRGISGCRSIGSFCELGSARLFCDRCRNFIHL